MLIDLKHGEPIRFGADLASGVVLNEFGECEIVDVADVGEDRSSCTTSTATTRGSRSRCRASPTRPTVPTPIGVFRDVASARSTSRPCSASWSRRQERGPGDLERAARLRRHLGRSVASRRLSRPGCGTPGPVRGLGGKNVVFWGMRTPAWARRGSGHVTGRSRIAAASPLRRASATARVVRYVERAPRGDAARPRPRTRRRRRRARAESTSSAALDDLGAGREQRRARRRRRGPGVPRRISRSAADAPRVCSRPASVIDVNARLRAPGSHRAVAGTSRWIGATQSSSSASSTTSAMIASAPGSSAGRSSR